MLPQGFIDEVSKYPALQVLLKGLQMPPEVSIRYNRGKAMAEARKASADRVPWCAEGVYLSDRPQFTFDPGMHQGLYYVQDASSMALSAVVRQLSGDSPLRYLDACAAPGGKTTTAIDALPLGSVVVANEYDYRRAEVLAENVSKWGYPSVVVSRGDTSRLKKLRGCFDIVAVDAPCSGEGMMRKDPQAVEQWSKALIDTCAATQREILSNVWETLRPGGYLIYSTCTFNRTENEENLHWLIDTYGAESVAIDALDGRTDIEKGIDTPHHCYRFLPGKVRGEGLFIAVVRKAGEAPAAAVKDKSAKLKIDLSEPQKWLNEDMQMMVDGEDIYALPNRNAAFMRHAASALDTLLTGVYVATVKGRDIKPTHQLALSQALRHDAFVKCELPYADAIKYLQRDTVTLPDGTPKGHILLTYKGTPLGFVKNLGNRSNNMMPKNWRILSKNIPLEQ